jgi:DNA-binding CsgD family transcriptional regulator
MNSVARISRESGEQDMPRDRAGLVRYLAQVCRDAGADLYLLVDLGCEDGDASLVACNWVFDAVRAIGPSLIRRLAESRHATLLGQPPRIWQPVAEAGERGSLGIREIACLEAAGHTEIACARIRTGRGYHAIVFSAAVAGSIDAGRLPSAILSVSYALSALAAASGGASAPSPVSDRERECLRWVAEGKTAEEIATIVGVSINTVNSYVSLAMHKLSAKNRAMAIANAIRAGVI